jgi:hypothetical protein
MAHDIRLWQKSEVIFSSKIFFFKQLPVSLEIVKIGVASKTLTTRRSTQQNFNNELIVQKLFVAKSLSNLCADRYYRRGRRFCQYTVPS